MDFALASSMPLVDSRIGVAQMKAVSARALYRNLGLNASQWARWSAANILENPFASEHEDWEVFDIMSSSPAGGRPTRDFFLAVPFAKKLAMQVRTAEGERVRTYFLECERRVHEADIPGPVQVLLSSSRTEILRLALAMSEERDALRDQATRQQATIATLEPKAAALDRLSNATGNHCVTDAAKALGLNPSELFTWLAKHEWIYRRPGCGTWIAFQSRIDAGYLLNKVHTLAPKIVHEAGQKVEIPGRVVDRLLVTPKGLARLGELLAKAAS
jgi:anti-repressor protein